METRDDPNLILAYVEGELSEAQARRFEQRYADDASLAALVRDLQSDREALRALPQEALAAGHTPADVALAQLERQLLLGSGPVSTATTPSADRPVVFRLLRIASYVGLAAALGLTAVVVVDNLTGTPLVQRGLDLAGLDELPDDWELETDTSPTIAMGESASDTEARVAGKVSEVPASGVDAFAFKQSAETTSGRQDHQSAGDVAVADADDTASAIGDVELRRSWGAVGESSPDRSDRGNQPEATANVAMDVVPELALAPPASPKTTTFSSDMTTDTSASSARPARLSLAHRNADDNDFPQSLAVKTDRLIISNTMPAMSSEWDTSPPREASIRSREELEKASEATAVTASALAEPLENPKPQSGWWYLGTAEVQPDHETYRWHPLSTDRPIDPARWLDATYWLIPQTHSGVSPESR